MILLKIYVKGCLDEIWSNWNNPDDIKIWYQGHQDLRITTVTNPLAVGEKFSYVMEHQDQNYRFTLKGSYIAIDKNIKIKYSLEDERIVETTFHQVEDKVMITQKVDLDKLNATKDQAFWWRSILINFKKYIETKNNE